MNLISINITIVFFLLFKLMLRLFLHQQRVKGGDGVIGLGNWFSAKSS